MPALFSLGQVVMTTNLQHTLDNGDPDSNSMEELQTLIDRHVAGDWGDLDAQDKAANDQALKTSLTTRRWPWVLMTALRSALSFCQVVR